MLFDTHFHLDLTENPEKVAALIEQQKIYTIAVTNLPKLFENTEKLCAGYKYIRPALGYHPELASRYNDQFQQFLELIDRTRYIGEIGLDNQKKTKDDFNIQKVIFEKIISACATKRNKILTIHSRRAEDDVISILGNNFPGKVILHWYSGSLKELEKALSYGFYFSINTAMVKSKNGINIIRAIPLNRILLETDGPFIEFDGKKSTPLMSIYIFKALGELKEVTNDNLTETLKMNFHTLLSTFD